MSSLMRLIRAEPVSFNGVIVAATGLAILLGLDEKVGGGIAVFIGAVVTWLVRANVNTVAKTVAAVTEAAHKSAVQTAENLTEETVGTFGRTTETAVDVVADATQNAVRTTLQEAGFSRKDRQAA